MTVTKCPNCKKMGLLDAFKGQWYYGCTNCGWRPSDGDKKKEDWK